MRIIGKSGFKAAAVAMAVMLLGAATALAANVHFKSGPSFTDNGQTLTASGELVGLGNGDVTVNLTATGTATTTCTSPGGNEAPGQNPAAVTPSGSQFIPNDQVKNGWTPFTVSTKPPANPTPKQAGCPNNRWTVTVNDVSFTSATIEVIQNHKTVLTTTCTFPATSDGAVPDADVSCS